MLRSGVAGMVLAMPMTAPAVAHITVQPREAAAASYAQLTFSVPHGCEASATVAIRVEVPDGIVSAKPQMKPGWRVEITTKKLATPQTGPHGGIVSEVVDEVIWRGGPLPDNLYDTFGLIVRTPDKAGQALYFPVVQECEKGEARWTEIPARGGDAAGLHHPAPAVRLTTAPAAHTHHH
jgi:uncharacterized protein YcnI